MVNGPDDLSIAPLCATLCIIDNRPRQMTEADLKALKDLADLAQDELSNLTLSRTNALLSALQKVERALALAIVERRTLRDKFRIVWPDGSIHWIAAQGEPFFDEEGKPVKDDRRGKRHHRATAGRG